MSGYAYKEPFAVGDIPSEDYNVGYEDENEPNFDPGHQVVYEGEGHHKVRGHGDLDHLQLQAQSQYDPGLMEQYQALQQYNQQQMNFVAGNNPGVSRDSAVDRDRRRNMFISCLCIVITCFLCACIRPCYPYLVKAMGYKMSHKVNAVPAIVACACVIGVPVGGAGLLFLYYYYQQSENALKTVGMVSGLLGGVTLTSAWMLWSGSLVELLPPSTAISICLAIVIAFGIGGVSVVQCICFTLYAFTRWTGLFVCFLLALTRAVIYSVSVAEHIVLNTLKENSMMALTSTSCALVIIMCVSLYFVKIPRNFKRIKNPLNTLLQPKIWSSYGFTKWVMSMALVCPSILNIYYHLPYYINEELYAIGGTMDLHNSLALLCVTSVFGGLLGAMMTSCACADHLLVQELSILVLGLSQLAVPYSVHKSEMYLIATICCIGISEGLFSVCLVLLVHGYTASTVHGAGQGAWPTVRP